MKYAPLAVALLVAQPSLADCDHFQNSGKISMTNNALGVTLVAGTIRATIDATKHEVCYDSVPERGVTITPAHVCVHPGEKEKFITISAKGILLTKLALRPEPEAEKMFRSLTECTAS